MMLYPYPFLTIIDCELGNGEADLAKTDIFGESRAALTSLVEDRREQYAI